MWPITVLPATATSEIAASPASQLRDQPRFVGPAKDPDDHIADVRRVVDPLGPDVHIRARLREILVDFGIPAIIGGIARALIAAS